MHSDLVPAVSAVCTIIAVFGAPLWVPIAMLIYHGRTAEKFWQFSLGFLLTLTAAECIAMTISVGAYRLLVATFPDLPGK